jgi:Na+/phosphate symporter
MKPDEIKKYEDNLSNYSLILRGDEKNKDEILECIRIFEYFEDYEKCKDLIKVLDNIEAKK